MTAALRFEAFGDSRTAREWSEDPRCVVSLLTLKTRLRKWTDVEGAITTPLMYQFERVRTSAVVVPVENPTPSITYGNATMPAGSLRMTFSEPARGAACLHAYSLPSKGLST